MAALYLLLAACPAWPVTLEKEFGKHSLYAEFEDPYYFSAGLYFSLTRNPVPFIDTISELPVYRHLLLNALKPNCFLLEIGVYPIPLAGVAARSWAPNVYNRAQISGSNIINAITESVDFKEPWSVSAFAGHTVRFKGADSASEGHGNAGLLASYGYWHIKDNALVPTHWGELEIKLKVDKGGNDRRYANSYRIGTRIHSDRDIKDVFYVGIRRDRTDFKEKGFSLIRNTNVQLRADFSYRPLAALSLTAQAGKKFPFVVKGKTYVLGLSLGFAWNINNPYKGAIGQGFVPNGVAPIVNPMIKF